MTRRLLLNFVFLFSCLTSLYAQNSISGIVYDQATDTPLPFVYLKVDGIALGTVTEADGTFRITIPAKYDERDLLISYLGYETRRELVKTLRPKAQNGQLRIDLKPEAALLSEITVTPKKLPSARAILRRALRAIPDNYPDQASTLTGYYRETLKENGAYIKFTDAAVEYRSEPYQKKKYRWKEYTSPYAFGTTLQSAFFNPNESLHRVHFHHQTLKKEAVRILDSRASLNGSSRDMDANIVGGPLSLIARDRVKYQQSFLGPHLNRDYDYLVDEVEYEDGKYVYSLSFRTTVTKGELEALPSKKSNKQWRKANKHKLLQGTILIDPDSYAILGYDCSVPNELKSFFCGYTTMAIKHFDYKLKVRYKKWGGKYVIDYLRHEDEFIFKDTVENVTTPYAAISEFRALGADLERAAPISVTENFANVEMNQLYDYALEHDSLFWQQYTEEHPVAAISEDIRQDMEGVKSLEQQFHDKHTRDPNLLPPVAKIEPTTTIIHGEKLTDDYAWLKDPKAARANKPVMEYLRAENDFTDNYFTPLRRLQRELYQEFVLQTAKNYRSLPSKKDGYLYHIEYQEEQEHPVYYRTPVGADSTKKELLIDVNIEAEKHDYYTVAGLTLSPNNNLLAFGENTTGSDKYVVRFKNLEENTMLADTLTEVAGLVWINNSLFLYTALEPKTLRSYRVMRHRLGTPQSSDELIYEEQDPLFGVSCYKSKSKEFIFISSGSNNASELQYLRTDNPGGSFKVMLPREQGHHYSISDHKDKFFIRSDRGGINYALYTTDTTDFSPKNWDMLIPHRKDVLLQSYLVFDNYLVLSEKAEAQDRLRVIDRRTRESHYLREKDDIYSISIGSNPETDSEILRYSFNSFTQEPRTLDYNMRSRESKIIKKEKRGFPPSKIIVKRIWATADDGTQIPITLAYSKWMSRGKKSEHKRVYLTSYGAYGSGSGPGYSHFVNMLLRRGFVYAIAHVRGGDDMGMQWYHDGRMLKKKNTFTDFINCAEFLIKEGYAQPGSITAQGGSAGGLLMGAIANMRPDLFKAVILDVPFVDVINTMLDDKLPLTTGEYEEWGNPNKKKYYKYMKSYSPYDNVVAQAYPHMFFFTGLNDTRVGYWEPAKMVAKLRATKTNDNFLFLKTNLSAGHGGGSGRYSWATESAYKLALLFDLYAAEELEEPE